MKILGLLFCMAFSSCGFLSDGPAENQDLYTSRDPLGPACELDPDRISRIFDEDVTDQIDCLRENFVQFSRFVITQNPDSISENELTQFIEKFFAQNSFTIVKALRVLFELNMVMLRDHASTLSRDNIDSLAELLINVNREGIVIAQLMRTMTGPDRVTLYPEVRNSLEVSLKRLSQQTIQIIAKTDRLPQNLDLAKFILSFEDSFQINDNFINEEVVEPLLFLKQIFVGGDRKIITSDEVIVLVERLPELFLEAFDLIFVRESHFNESEEELLRFYQAKIKRLYDLLMDIPLDTPLFTEEQLFHVYDTIMDSTDPESRPDFDLHRYKKTIRSLKTNILGGEVSQYTYADLRSLMLIGSIGIEGTLFLEDYDQLVADIKTLGPKQVVLRRTDFVELFASFSTALARHENDFNALPSQMDLVSFFKTLNQEFEEFDFHPDMLDALGPLKVYLFGGPSPALTQPQWQALRDRLGELAYLIYDVSYLLPVADETQLGLPQVLASLMDRLENLPTVNTDRGALLERRHIDGLLQQFVTDQDQRTRFTQLYETFSLNILRTPPTQFDIGHLKRSQTFIRILAKVMDFFPFHQEMVDLFEKREDQSYQELKARYLERFNPMVRELQTLASREGLIESPLYYIDFLLELPRFFDDFELDSELVNDFAPIKTLILGGDADLLAQEEATSLLEKLATLAPWALDALYGPDFDDRFLVRANRVLTQQFFDLTGEHELLTLEHIAKVAERFVDLPVTKFLPTLSELKRRILGGEGNSLRGVDIGKILALAQEYFELNYFNDITYEAMGTRLDNITSPITLVPQFNLIAYQELTPANLALYRERFADSVSKHRYFRNAEDGMQHWGHRIHRNKWGFKELTGIKWLIAQVLPGWGSRTEGAYLGYTLTMQELEQVLLDARPVLEEFGLWTANFDTFARNTLLLGDLFQNRSDGNQKLDIDELVEYGLMVFSAIELNNRFMEKLTAYCEPLEGDGPETWKFETPCYREHFYPIILDQLGNTKYFPMLTQYVRTSPAEEVAQFVRDVEGFARDTDDQSVPMGRRDYILLIGAMINIETTFLRFDSNQDNIIDPQELELAFAIYKDAIIQIAELDEENQRFANSIFLYMIKNKAIPSRVQLINFHYNPFISKNISALRLNIGALLYYLVNN